ncbi:MAG: TIGR04282 family arsenosugar biosynthesis glycosyltransferase [Xanthomonadales bacterium]|nr:TIGR04282 family arsenosugar biosynthesis glycosyltransferase [Xanthomonadales bacterium]
MIQASGRVLVFARAPVLGQVKTRIARDAGDEAALEVYLHLLDRTLQTVSDSGCAAELWIAGDGDHPIIRSWRQHSGWPVRRQQGDDLGARMHHALVSALAEGEPALVVGVDCPGLRPAQLHQGLDALRGDDAVVFGPALDGGYYLVGLAQPQPGLFQGVDWGTERVLEQSVELARQLRLEVTLLDPQADIDTWSDWLQQTKNNQPPMGGG